jgi:amino acid adenylation domain-containing protein
MDDVYDFLVELKSLGARLYSEDDRIKLDIEPGVLTSEISDKIKYYRKEILSLLQESNNKSDFVEIEKLPSQESYALSDGQRRLWILSQFEGGATAYQVLGTLYFDSKVNVETFKKSLWSVLERHESLRTVYREDDSGELRQWILSVEDSRFNIDYQDVRSEQNKVELVESYLGKISREEFDLGNVLFKVSLIRLEEEDYVFYYKVHHINTDGWSMSVFMNDLRKFYDAYQAGQTPDIAPLKFQYKDFAAWQLKMLEDESANSHRKYWLESLKGVLPRLDLPSYKSRPKVLTYGGEAYKGSFIGEQTITKLKKYSKKNGGSLFMGLIAAWNVLMYRYTSQKDIIIGTPLNGREHADTVDQIGFYVNTLAIRNKLSPEESFGSVFKKVKQNMLDAYSHQSYPFNRLVQELNLPKDTSRNTVFDIMLVFGSDKKNDSSLDGGPSNSMIQVEYLTIRFDLEIGFREIDGYVQVLGVYNPDVYREVMLEGLIRHYKQLLNALLETPEEKISQIDYLSEEEKYTLLVTNNDTAVAYPKDKTIVDLFEEQAAKTPDHIAVVFEDRELTYGELNARSNQLAHYLRENYDIQPDGLIGIKQERSEWMIISILGVLKSGGAYVPIDPDYPQERIDYIEKDTNCKVCLDEEELSKFKESQERYSKEPVSSTAKEENLAYVIYTSGSTGKPKGVMVEHKSAYSFIKWSHDEFKNSDFDMVLFTTSLNFDLSVFEVFHPLTSGKELKVLKDGLSIAENLDAGKKLLINTVPSVVGALLQRGMSFESVSVLNMAGEPIPSNYKEEMRGKVREIRNLYGPSEDTTYTTVFRVDDDERDLIGKPISNTQIYVLSEKEELQPIGVTGEICIGGAGLARGYLNQEELTNEKFIASPFKEGERLYKTGDLGRWLADGNIEFIGRKDDQVKIRGYRIELGEIKNVLESFSGIASTVVLAKSNKEGDKTLIAFYTAKESISTSQLRNYLNSKLPAYYIPSFFVQLDELPLTSSGKVNKLYLQSLSLNGIQNDNFIPPSSILEIAIASIWKEVLSIETMSIYDDFFRLGGNSLMIFNVISLIKAKIGVELHVADFMTKNLEQIAKKCEIELSSV